MIDLVNGKIRAMTYHHGDLREATLDAAAAAIARDGVAAVSLRGLARELGVTHAAPRHHFGDKRGVLTALATQGYVGLAEQVRRAGEDFLQAGVSYIRWALQHPGHYAVMFRPELVDEGDPEHRAAFAGLSQLLSAGAGSAERAGELSDRARAAWSMAHGFATLAQAGNFADRSVGGLCDLAETTLRELGGGAA